MKDKSEVTKEDLETIERLVKMTKMTTYDVRIMSNMIRKYIDNKCFICEHCSAQIVYGHKRLKIYYEKKLK